MFRGTVHVTKDDRGTISIDSSVRNDDDGDARGDENDAEYLSRMLDKNLIAKYQTLNTDNLHLKLSIRPIEATLEHIFAVWVK